MHYLLALWIIYRSKTGKRVAFDKLRRSWWGRVLLGRAAND